MNEHFPQFAELEAALAREGLTEKLQARGISLESALFLGMTFAAAWLAGWHKVMPGIQSDLESKGWNPIAARGLAHVVVRHGNRVAKEAACWRPVCRSIQFLAKHPRQTRAVWIRAKLLLEIAHDTGVIHELCEGAGVDFEELIQLLEAVSQKRPFDSQRLFDLFKELRPHLPDRRGPKPRAISRAYEFILRNGQDPSGISLPEFRDSEGLAEAIRLEFKDPEFDPRPARRRLKRAP